MPIADHTRGSPSSPVPRSRLRALVEDCVACRKVQSFLYRHLGASLWSCSPPNSFIHLASRWDVSPEVVLKE